MIFIYGAKNMGVSFGKFLKELNQQMKMVLPYAQQMVSGNDVFFIYDKKGNAYYVDFNSGNKCYSFHAYDLKLLTHNAKSQAKCELLQKNKIHEKELCLDLIFVNQNYHNLGIGSKLLELAEYAAKKDGYNKLEGLVMAFDEQMLQRTLLFYKKNNYEIVQLNKSECVAKIEKSLTANSVKLVEETQTVVEQNGIRFHILPPEDMEQPLQNYYGHSKAM